jgi:hypothetical protein
VLGTPPQLWGWMCTHWCPLPASAAWLWWRAVTRAEWSTVVQWRERFLAFDKPDRTLSSDLVEAFLQESATPKQLVGVLEELQREGKLLKRDAHQLEEGVFCISPRRGIFQQYDPLTKTNASI